MEYCTVFFTGLVLLLTASPTITKQYRSDYEYNSRTDAFYKLHTESVRYWKIDAICRVEGALPMVPNDQRDIVQLHAMFKNYPDLGDYVWVGDDGQTHEPAPEPLLINLDPFNPPSGSDEVTGCDVVTRNGDIETLPCHRELPFICKVPAQDTPHDHQCGVKSRDYTYFSTLGSCYKVPQVAYTWSQAYEECQTEGAHLVVLNSRAEADAVQNMTQTQKVPGAHTPWFFFVGFRANRSVGDATRVFKTIFNQTLEEAGFSQWSPNEPNNFHNNEYCGSIFANDGNLNDMDCSVESGFVCEKETTININN